MEEQELRNSQHPKYFLAISDPSFKGFPGIFIFKVGPSKEIPELERFSQIKQIVEK